LAIPTAETLVKLQQHVFLGKLRSSDIDKVKTILTIQIAKLYVSHAQGLYVSKSYEVPERMSHRCLFRRQDQRSAARRLLHARFRCKLSEALRRNISYVSAILWWSHQVELQPASCMPRYGHTISPMRAIGKAGGIGSGSRIAVVKI
jgi:hypothetical protein